MKFILLVLSLVVTEEVEFKFNCGIEVDKMYSCFNLDCNLKEKQVITKVTGKHQPQKSNKDISVLYLTSANTKWMPGKLLEFFPNIQKFFFICPPRANHDCFDSQMLKHKVFDEQSQVMTSLCIQGHKLPNVFSRVFQNVPNLNELFLSDNQIEFLDKDAFKLLKKVTRIQLSNNFIYDINPDTFYNNMDLTSVELNRNSLTTLPRYLFKTNKKLNYVDFSQNKIQFVHPELQNNLDSKSLKYFGFSLNNCISSKLGVTVMDDLKTVLHNCSDFLKTSLETEEKNKRTEYLKEENQKVSQKLHELKNKEISENCNESPFMKNKILELQREIKDLESYKINNIYLV